MTDSLDIREVPLNLKRARKHVEELLTDCNLQPDLPELYLGVYDADERLVAGGGLDGNIIKGVAVREEMRGRAVVNALISRLLQIAYTNGDTNVFVYTKPEYRSLFESLALHCIAACDWAVLLEYDPRGVASYCNRLKQIASDGGTDRGVIVMNCNPLTLGHRYLIEQAASQVDTLYIIPVKEDLSMFSYADRRAMMEECCKDFYNVKVCPGSDYIISRATFPTYFLKACTDTATIHIALDCDMFSRHILPALGASVRFVGTEPADPLTRSYNETMNRLLPCEVRQIPRLCVNGQPVSASRLRDCIINPMEGNPLLLAHKSAKPYVLAHMACQALETELATTPKPGLVDLHDNGAHSDMNPDIMRRGIRALLPYFVSLAKAGKSNASADRVRCIGIKAERAMLAATNGVNTHRGALFALGLTLYAVYHSDGTDASISKRIKEMAERLSGRSDEQEVPSHGSQARARGCHGGAMAMALTGYSDLINIWLPFYRYHRKEPYAAHKTLLLIMSTLTDTNVAFRAGNQIADRTRRQARELLDDFSIEGVQALNKEFIAENISPGGAADMLALTLLFNNITDNKP